MYTNCKYDSKFIKLNLFIKKFQKRIRNNKRLTFYFVVITTIFFKVLIF